MNWKSGSDRSLILAALCFIFTGILIHKAREFASAAQNERTTTAHVVAVHHHIFRGLRFNYYSCNYSFTVDGTFHFGLGDCPKGIVDDTIKRERSGSTGSSAGTETIVYFDPADPSINSLLEFTAAGQDEYRVAAPWIGLDVLVIFFFVFGRVLIANEKKRNGGVVVDGRGTIIYPDEMHIGLEFADAPNGTSAPFASQPRLRELYLEVVNKIHPDRAANEIDRALRERLMKEANGAFELGDIDALRRVLEDYTSATPAS